MPCRKRGSSHMDAFDIIAALVALFPILMLIVVNAAESLKSDPQLSNREHARRTGASTTTVGAVRGEMEKTGDVSKLDTLTGASTTTVGSVRKEMEADGQVCESHTSLGADGKTVGTVRSDMEKSAEIPHFERRELESTGEIPQSETRVSGDGRLEQYSSRMSAELVAGGEIPHVDVAQRYFSSHFVTRGVPRVPAQKSRKGVGLCTHPAK